jgi:CheY-like chemotaxis protein
VTDDAHPPGVLVIDDDPFVRRTVAALLAGNGFGVLEAGDGARGVALLRERRAEVDLVLLDMSMPGLDGPEALAQLRAVNPDVPVIVLSGNPVDQTRDALGGAAVEDVLVKPFLMQDALRAIRRTLEPR